MSSWIPSLFNPFADDDNPNPPEPSSPNKTPSSGAKDDLSAVFRGVAAFLAPPQKTSLSAPSSSSETIEGIKNDLAEIQGSFRSGLSLISSKLTSNLMQLQDQFSNGGEYDEVEEEEGIGITDEVFDFVLKISRRPELWIDFPLSLPDDFDMSDYQREHAASIDHLVPDFEKLRLKICSQISEGKFWLIYFILLLPRLDEEDLDLLSTPQVAEARETLLNKLQHNADEDQETSESPESSDPKQTEIVNESFENANATKQAEIVNESPEIANSTKQAEIVSESPENANATKQAEIVNEAPENANATKQAEIVSEAESGHHQSEEVDMRPKQSENVEDVSFSDLEDDDNNPSAPKVPLSNKAWFQVDENSGSQKADERASEDKKSEGEDSNDWLTVDDTDFDNLGAV